MKRLGTPLATLVLLFLAACLWAGAAPSQESPASPSPAASPLVPRTQDLPPLELPPIPEEEGAGVEDEPGQPGMEEVPEAPASPAQAPAPLPVPTGTPLVKPDLPIGGVRFYALEYDGHLVGYSRYEVERLMELGGQSSYLLREESRIKLGLGAIDDARFTAKLMVNRKDLTPTYFICAQGEEGKGLGVECVYTQSMVAQKNLLGSSQTHHFHNYEGRAPLLVFNNLWGHLDTFPDHYWLLVRSAARGGVVTAYDPILRGQGQVVVYAPIAEKIDWNGTPTSTLVYPVSDLKGTLLARVRVRSGDFELLEVREVGNGLVMRRTTEEVIKKVAKAPGLDLAGRRVRPSNVYFPEPEKVTALEADLEISLRGGQFADHRVTGYRQYFTGEMREGYMKGSVTVRAAPVEVRYKTPFPLKNVPDDLKVYLKPEAGVESDYPGILNKAMELTWKSENTFAAAKRLNNFAGSEVQEGVSLPSARYALESRTGNPESRAVLLVALARAAGLPARRVGGLLFRDGAFVPHYWAEIWLGPEEGWAPFDPSTFEAGRIGGTHIALWESGTVQSLNIRVKNYAPRAPKRVAYFNTELNWPVGEERVYAILRDGQKVGTEVARLKDMEVVDNREIYHFEAQAELSGAEAPFQATSQLLLDPAGLPIRFQIQAQSNDDKVEEILSFTGDSVRQEIQASPEPVVREVPFSRGTYLTDQRFLSQWALVVGQAPRPEKGGPWKVGEKYTFHVFVPEDLRTREMVLEVRDPETITLGDGNQVEAQRFESDKGMVFYLNDKNQVVRIFIPQQKLDVVLEKIRFRLE